MTSTTPTFQGFEARTDKGTPCFVKNEGQLTDGTPAYKVRLGQLAGYTGWSGGASARMVYMGKEGWLAKSKVICAKRRAKRAAQ